jgi:hypothetical protein
MDGTSQKNKHIADMETCMAQEEEESDDDWMYPCKFDPVAAEKSRRVEEEEMHQRIAAKKRMREDPMQHYEGESDVEDIFDNAAQSADVPAVVPLKKQVKKLGPTLRSHSQVEVEDIPD